jgi:hypothetical protein
MGEEQGKREEEQEKRTDRVVGEEREGREEEWGRSRARGRKSKKRGLTEWYVRKEGEERRNGGGAGQVKRTDRVVGEEREGREEEWGRSRASKED